MSRLEELERCPIFAGDPTLATREKIWELFNQSPYYEQGQALGLDYQSIPQHEDASGLAQAYIIFGFEQKEHSQTKLLKQVYYVTGQLSNDIDQCRPGFIFPLPDLYHTLLTKFTLAVDCISVVCDNIRLSLDIQQEAEHKIEKYNQSLEKTIIADRKDTETSSKNHSQTTVTRPAFRRLEESMIASYALSSTMKHFDLSEDFD